MPKLTQRLRNDRITHPPARAAVASLFTLFAAIALTTGCKQYPAAAVAPAPLAAAAPASDASQDATQDVFVNSIGMEFAPVYPGDFIMGSPPDEPRRYDDETQHKVTITKPFLLAVNLVTQRQYAAVMGTNPSYFRGDEDMPVESVSWFDAVAFCKKLGAKDGNSYRLPTEAEWEFACRAGTTGPYAGDGKIDDIGWYLGNADGTTHPVGMLDSNDWGFFDMQGNVWEWCSDWYGAYPPGDAVDPTGPATGVSRILRGGSMEYGAEACRSAFRNYYPPDAQLYYIGFRVAMDAP